MQTGTREELAVAKGGLQRADQMCIEQATALRETREDLRDTHAALHDTDVKCASLSSENSQLTSLLTRERADCATLQVRAS